MKEITDDNIRDLKILRYNSEKLQKWLVVPNVKLPEKLNYNLQNII